MSVKHRKNSPTLYSLGAGQGIFLSFHPPLNKLLKDIHKAVAEIIRTKGFAAGVEHYSTIWACLIPAKTISSAIAQKGRDLIVTSSKSKSGQEERRAEALAQAWRLLQRLVRWW